MTIHQNGLFVQPDRGRSYYFSQDLYTFSMDICVYSWGGADQ